MKRELQKRKKEKLEVDKSFKLTMLFLLLVVFSYAQKKEISYEQVALNYFIKEVVPDKFPNIKYIISNKKIENEKSDDYLFCYYFKNNKGNQIIEKKNTLIISRYKVYPKSNFFTKYFISTKRIGNLYVFQYSKKNKNQVYVTVHFAYRNSDYFYSFLINCQGENVVDYCFEKWIE